ncbi:MAG: BT1926 family outer membrane beta-barrel protein [Dysgonomonas sp.]
MKKILCLVMLLSFGFSAFAQNSGGVEPKKGDWMFSVNFGVGSYIGTSAPKPNLSNYTLSAPMSAWFDKDPILDVEGKWFVSDKWALKLTGGFNYGYNPAYNEVTGTVSGAGTIESGVIPTYNAIPSSDNIQFFIGVGVDHYFKTKWNQLYLRAGGEFGYAYGRVTVNAEDSQDYMGASLGEAYAMKVAPVFGADYFFNQALFIGFDIRPFEYQYSTYSERPQAGLSLLSSDNHTFSILSRPTIKLGVRF